MVFSCLITIISFRYVHAPSDEPPRPLDEPQSEPPQLHGSRKSLHGPRETLQSPGWASEPRPQNDYKRHQVQPLCLHWEPRLFLGWKKVKANCFFFILGIKNKWLYFVRLISSLIVSDLVLFFSERKWHNLLVLHCTKLLLFMFYSFWTPKNVIFYSHL